MSKIRVEYKHLYTTTRVQKLLNLSRHQLDLRLARNILPVPTFVSNGVRYFDEEWVTTALDILTKPNGEYNG